MRRVIVLLCIVLLGLASNVIANPYSDKYYLKGYQDFRWCDQLNDDACMLLMEKYLTWRHLRTNLPAYQAIIERFSIWLLSSVKGIDINEAKVLYESDSGIKELTISHGYSEFLNLTYNYFAKNNSWPKADRFEYSYKYFAQETDLNRDMIKVYRRRLNEL